MCKEIHVNFCVTSVQAYVFSYVKQSPCGAHIVKNKNGAQCNIILLLDLKFNDKQNKVIMGNKKMYV
jgi:hypothetical protein